MNKKNFIIIIEYAWVLMAVFCIGMGIYYQIKIGIDKAWLIYGLAFVSLGMFGVRRMQRKNSGKRHNRNN
jgi:hypothetical protein